jgi:glutamyl-tRNA synthetase
LLDLLRVRARTTHDIVRQAAPYFDGSIEYDAAAAAKHWKDRELTLGLLEDAETVLESAPAWTPDSLEPLLRQLAEQRRIAAGQLFQPLRIALTGLAVSPGIFEVLVMMGRERALRRLKEAAEWVRSSAL